MFGEVDESGSASYLPANELWAEVVTDRKFVRDIINVRTIYDSNLGSKIVLGIPGGPGIHGQYMDQVTVELAQAIGATPMVLDLPNHGLSTRLNSVDLIKYPEARLLLRDFLLEISYSGSSIILFGHSLGAVIALDLLHSQTVPIAKAILVGMPIEFERNPRFTKFLSDTRAPTFSDEPGFVKWWRAVLPAYFFRTPRLEDVKLLAHQTSWFSNQQFTAGLASAGTIMSSMPTRSIEKIVYVEGEAEIILPDKNFERISDLLLPTSRARIPKSGHFPMLENSKGLIKEITKHF